MKTFNVKWEIEIDANSEIEAAKIALEIQRDLNSVATVFIVDGQEIDATDALFTSEDINNLFNALSKEDQVKILETTFTRLKYCHDKSRIDYIASAMGSINNTYTKAVK